jgi:hypothetical protein
MRTSVGTWEWFRQPDGNDVNYGRDYRQNAWSGPGMGRGNAMGWLIAGTGFVANAEDEAVFLVEVLKLMARM